MPNSPEELIRAAAKKYNAPSLPPRPDVVRVDFMAPRHDTELDRIVDGIGVIDAYDRWVGKKREDVRGRTESIKVSCPVPGHVDSHPSAWVNTDKNTWYCSGCSVGGDVFDIAANYFNIPDYKSGKNFVELRERMAASMGYSVTSVNGHTTVTPTTVTPTTVTPTPPPPASPGVPTLVAAPSGDGDDDYKDDDLAPVIALYDEAPLVDTSHISLDWRPLCSPGTFLASYMKQATIDDVPEEYHFWNALLAISLAIGRSVTLADGRPVYGNLFVCTLGRTGSGKSKAKWILDELLRSAFPYDAADPLTKGAQYVSNPASGEALVAAFQRHIPDMAAPKGPGILYPVKGIIEYSELASLIARAARQGSSLLPTLIDFYDAPKQIEAHSRTYGREVALEPYACALTTSQPKSLSGLLTKNEAASGFANRWVYVIGKEKKRIAVGGAIPDITPAVELIQDVAAWAAATGGTLDWDQDALDAFTAMFDLMIIPKMDSDESELLSRLDLLCKKLILLLSANQNHILVMPETVRMVEKMLPYLIECYQVAGTRVGQTLQSEVSDAILSSIARFQVKTGKGPTLRDIVNRSLKRRGYPLDLLEKTIKSMIYLDLLVETRSVPARGRPSVRYTVLDPEATLRELGAEA